MYTVIGIHIIMHKCFRNTFFFHILQLEFPPNFWGSWFHQLNKKNRIPELEGTIGYHHFGWGKPHLTKLVLLEIKNHPLGNALTDVFEKNKKDWGNVPT